MFDDDYSKDLLIKLGARLRALRIKKGFKNYEHFAYAHGLSRAQYGRYETGHNITFTSLLKILKIHDISLKDFFADGFE